MLEKRKHQNRHKKQFRLPRISLLFALSCFFLSPAAVSFARDQLCDTHQNGVRGPHLECTYCHADPDLGSLKDGLSLAETGVCNACHSPAGQYDGVNDAVAGAKSNWKSGGVYEGGILRPEKQKWCVGCHDEGSSVIDDVTAPNIAGLSMSGNWQSPVSIVSPSITGAEKLLDNDLATGCTAGGIIFDLGEPVTISHIRLYVYNADVYWNVYGGNDLVTWTRILYGQGVLSTAPRWRTYTSLPGEWSESRLDRYKPFRYLKLVKISPWPVNSSALREFKFKKDLQYGYYVTGHKMACTQCHDAGKAHIDGEARTYHHESSPYNDDDAHNYQNGYRLKKVDIGGTLYPPLEIPRTGINWAEYPREEDDFALCVSCHDKYNLLGDASSSGDFFKPVLQTNFWNINAELDSLGNVRNQHIVHLRGRYPYGNAKDWDSDWDGSSDSPQSCTGCHNVHGTPSPGMVRHGELISTPEKDKTPTVNLYRLNDAGQLDEKVSLLESIGGKTQFWGSGPGYTSRNGICNMCHNESLTYLRDPVEAVSCVACHARPFDTRRQVTGEAGDFVLPSHHVTDGTANQVVKDQDCKDCHDQTRHTEGVVWLRNADGGAPCAYDSAIPATAEPACLSCHDSDLEVPFSDGAIVPDIENGNYWSTSAHASGSTARVSCMGDGIMTGCHDNAHGSQKPSLLAPSETSVPQEEGICYACHDGQPVEKDVQVPFQKMYRHPIERSGLHQTDESGVNLGQDNRHSECLDCHNPHAAGARVHTPTGNLIAEDNVLKGTWGVEPVADPQALPGQQISQFIELKAPNYPQGAAKEYQICFKCHSYYALGWADHGVTGITGPSGDKITDQAMEFSPANLAAHPVVMATSEQPGAYAPRGLEPIQLKDPWKANARCQTMYCSDCHGTDTANTSDAQGPHGSNQRFLLKDPSGGTRTYWPERPDGKLWTLFDLQANLNDWQNKLFCAACHPFLDDSLPGSVFVNNVHQKGAHHSQHYIINGQDYEGAPCVTCHVAVPHGTAVSRLIAYRQDVAPYNYGGNTAVITDFLKAGRNSYAKWNCSISDALWGCHTRGVVAPKIGYKIVYDVDAFNPPRTQNISPMVMSNNPDSTIDTGEITIFSGAGAYDLDGSISSLVWDFGDGTSASGILAPHAYQTAGTHLVTLTVTDNDGAQTSGTIASITVRPPNKKPIANAGPDQTVLACQTVFFSGAASSDPDGTITRYRWDFGDGVTAEGAEVSHAFEEFEHTYQVLLTVTDNSGAHNTDMVSIVVNLQ